MSLHPVFNNLHYLFFFLDLHIHTCSTHNRAQRSELWFNLQKDLECFVFLPLDLK